MVDNRPFTHIGEVPSAHGGGRKSVDVGVGRIVDRLVDVKEKEEFVLDDRTADATAEIVKALERHAGREEVSGVQVVVLEVIVG